jgi:MFS family permease
MNTLDLHRRRGDPHGPTHTDGANFTDRLTDFLLRERSRFWSLRLYFCCDIVATTIITTWAVESLNRQAFTALPGNVGWLAVVALAALGLLGLVDTIVNDLLPDRFRFPFGRRHRWMLFVGMALIVAMFIYVNLHDQSLLTLLLRHCLNVAGGFSLALLDLVERGGNATPARPS